jgi:hypothetical protein
MKRALLIAAGLMMMSAPLHAYVSGTMLSRTNTTRYNKTAPTTTLSETGTTDPVAEDPTIGMIDVRHERHIEGKDDEPGHPVPEPGTMVITSMGLLAAAAFRRKKKQETQQ